MRDNKGYSLVELVVVIAIMTILAGVVTVSIRSVFGTEAKQCAANMQSQINNTKQMTMAKSRVDLKIYVGTDGAYYADMQVYAANQTDIESTTTTKLGKKSVKVEYTTDSYMADNSFNTLTSTNPFVIEFDRSSGALKNPSACVRGIRITKGNHVKKITIYPETGKVKLENE